MGRVRVRVQGTRYRRCQRRSEGSEGGRSSDLSRRSWRHNNRKMAQLTYISRLVSQSVSQSVSQAVKQPVSQPVSQPASQPASQSVSYLVRHHSSRKIGRWRTSPNRKGNPLVVRFTRLLTYVLADLLTHLPSLPHLRPLSYLTLLASPDLLLLIYSLSACLPVLLSDLPAARTRRPTPWLSASAAAHPVRVSSRAMI